MVPVIDNIDDCAKHQATSLWFRSLQTPVSFWSTSALFTFHVNGFLVLVRKELRREQVCCEAEVMCLSFVVSLSSHVCWHSSFHVCLLMSTEQSSCSGSHTSVFCPSFLPQVCLIWGCACNSAVCSKACWKGVWAGMVGCKLKCRYRATSAESAVSHWCGNFGLEECYQAAEVGKGGERQRAIVLETDSCLLHGQILTPWDKGKPKFFGLALWSGSPWSPKDICCWSVCCDAAGFASANPTLWPV